MDAIGGYVKQYHVQPEPAKLNALGISFGDVAEAIERNNASRGAGYLDRNGEGYVVRTGGRIESMEEIGEVVVATRDGVPVRVKDVATSRSAASCAAAARARTGRRLWPAPR